jgi:succinate dehydrogenase / fumarate reductase membrane anchor subunit
MVSNVTSLTGNGVRDWLIQRVSAVYFALYAGFLFSFLVCHPSLLYSDWLALFRATGFQVASVLALIMLSFHTWIGIWTVTTDYIKCALIRVSLQMFVALFLIGQLIWGIMIVWG